MKLRLAAHVIACALAARTSRLPDHRTLGLITVRGTAKSLAFVVQLRRTSLASSATCT